MTEIEIENEIAIAIQRVIVIVFQIGYCSLTAIAIVFRRVIVIGFLIEYCSKKANLIVIVFQIEYHSQMGTVFATGFVSLLAEQVAEMVTRTAQLYDIPER